MRRFPAIRWVAVAVAAVGVYVAGRGAVAWAVVRAPNYGIERPERPLPPPDVAATIEVLVGPPRAVLSAWVISPPAHARPGTVLVLHGIRGHKADMLEVGRALAHAGWRAVLVDLRGHGASTGDYLTYGVVESQDLSLVLDALESRFEVGSVGVWGYSYGAAVAVQLAERDMRVRAVVAVAPFSTLRSAVDDYAHRYLPGGSLVPTAWLQGGVDWAGGLGQFAPDAASPVRAAAHVGPRLLVALGAADTQVTPRHTLELAAAAGRESRLLTVEHADHASVATDRTVLREGFAWLTGHLVPAD